jgi:hypothetical protein
MKVLGAIKKLVLMQDDPTNVYKCGHFKVGDPINVVWHELKYSVDDVKKMGYATNSTVNDVLLAALSSSLRTWGSKDKSFNNDVNLLSVIWVSKSPMSDTYKSIQERPIVWGNSNLCAVYMR